MLIFTLRIVGGNWLVKRSADPTAWLTPLLDSFSNNARHWIFFLVEDLRWNENNGDSQAFRFFLWEFANFIVKFSVAENDVSVELQRSEKMAQVISDF